MDQNRPQGLFAMLQPTTGGWGKFIGATQMKRMRDVDDDDEMKS